MPLEVTSQDGRQVILCVISNLANVKTLSVGCEAFRYYSSLINVKNLILYGSRSIITDAKLYNLKPTSFELSVFNSTEWLNVFDISTALKHCFFCNVEFKTRIEF